MTAEERLAAITRDVVNFRDFGRLASAHGGTIATGRLFRSGHLGAVTAEGAAALDAVGFGLIADLRFAKERQEMPSRWPAGGAIEVLSIPGGQETEGPHVAVLRSAGLDPAAIDRFYENFYRTIPYDPQFLGIFSTVLARLGRIDGAALVHCSVGKDRTGILVALVQHLLGVSREAIEADYLETRHAPGLLAMIPEIKARLEERLQQDVPPAIAQKMLGVEPGYIRAALDEIAARSGSIAAYLERLGVDGGRRDVLIGRLVG